MSTYPLKSFKRNIKLLSILFGRKILKFKTKKLPNHLSKMNLKVSKKDFFLCIKVKMNKNKEMKKGKSQTIKEKIK